MNFLPARRNALSSGTVAVNVALSLLSVSLLAGCVVGPDYAQPQLALPAQWGAERQKKPAKPLTRLIAPKLVARASHGPVPDTVRRI